MLSFGSLGPGKDSSAGVSIEDPTVSWTEALLCAFAALMRSAYNWSDCRRFRVTLSAMERPCSTQEMVEIQQSRRQQGRN